MAIPAADGPVLRLQPASRVEVGLWMACTVFMLVCFLAIGVGAVLSGLLRTPGPQEAGRVAQVLVGVGILASTVLPAATVRDQLRALRERDPYLQVGADGITVSNSGIFVDPQSIAANVIGRIFLGPGVSQSFSRRGRSGVVLAADVPTPNAILVFRQPVLLDRAYDSLSYSQWLIYRAHPPAWNQPVQQAWLAFDDPDHAYRVFHAWSAPVEWAEDAMLLD